MSRNAVWTEASVEEIKAEQANALATGPFGSSISSRYFQTSGVPVIRGSNLSEDVGCRLDLSDLVYLSPEKADEFRRSIARKGDLIFTCWGTVGQVGLIAEQSPFSEYVISNKQMKLTPDPQKANSLFLYYLFSGPEMSWFVDFDLERGPDWRMGQLSDLAENRRFGVDPSEVTSGTLYIGLEHMPRKSIALDQWGSSDSLASGKFAFNKGEILFGKLRPYFHKVGVAPADGICSTDILVVKPRKPEYFGIVLGYVSSDDFIGYTDRSSAGTKMPRTNWGDMARYKVVIPPEAIVRRHTDLIRPMIQRIISNIHESRTLAVLRDTLLPKLLSGEIRVKQAEKMVGEAV